MASGSVGKQKPEEFIVRVPKLNENKKIAILKFNANLNIDITQWTNVTLAREDNASVYVNPEQQPKSGVGSEFGKQTRDDARRKKLGYDTKRYKRDDQPWLFTVHTPATAAAAKITRKYRGIREGGVTQNADFWVFVKAGEGIFDALPVNEWYSFMPIARYKTLDADEAEEQFSHRNKILNQFALKMKLKTDENDDDEDETPGKKKDNKKVAIDDDDALTTKKKKGSDDEEDVSETKAVKTGKGKKKKPPKKKKVKRRNSDADENDLMASAESDDGDEEGREVDYMSDSDLSPSSEDEPEEMKNQKELRGVDEEDGIRKLMSSDEEEENEQNEAEGDEKKKVDLMKMESMPTASDFGGNEDKESDSGSDSDDPDKEDIKSAFFLKEKEFVPEDTVAVKTAPGTSSTTQSGGNTALTNQKRKHGPDDTSSVPAKKSKSERSKEKSNGITEDEVRRYLQRKPLSTTELVAKFKPRCQGMEKGAIVQCLADILKRLKPTQVRRNDVLYFTLGATETST